MKFYHKFKFKNYEGIEFYNKFKWIHLAIKFHHKCKLKIVRL
jgi:hypothetical protein